MSSSTTKPLAWHSHTAPEVQQITDTSAWFEAHKDDVITCRIGDCRMRLEACQKRQAKYAKAWVRLNQDEEREGTLLVARFTLCKGCEHFDAPDMGNVTVRKKQDGKLRAAFDNKGKKNNG